MTRPDHRLTPPIWLPISSLFGCFPDLHAQLSHRCPPFVEDQAVHVEGQNGQLNLGRSSLDADGANEQPHLGLLLREHMFDPGADL